MGPRRAQVFVASARRYDMLGKCSRNNPLDMHRGAVFQEWPVSMILPV